MTECYEAVELIQGADLADGSKEVYSRVLLPYLEAGHTLDDPDRLIEYARGLPGSRRATLRSALRLWARAKIERLEASVTPQTFNQVRAEAMRLRAISRLVKVPKRDGQRAHTWLSRPQVRALYAACGDGILGLRDKVVLGLLVSTGVRRRELVKIRWAHIIHQPFEGELCSILSVIAGKRGRDRAIPLTPQVDGLLEEWVTHTGRQGYVVRSLGNGLIVGDSLSDCQVFNIVRKRGALIGLPELAPHDLRRTFSQAVWERTGDLLIVSELLGHKQVETTRRYLQVDQAKKLDAVRAISWG